MHLLRDRTICGGVLWCALFQHFGSAGCVGKAGARAAQAQLLLRTAMHSHLISSERRSPGLTGAKRAHKHAAQTQQPTGRAVGACELVCFECVRGDHAGWIGQPAKLFKYPCFGAPPALPSSLGEASGVCEAIARQTHDARPSASMSARSCVAIA